jgi:hypothetical protein
MKNFKTSDINVTKLFVGDDFTYLDSSTSNDLLISANRDTKFSSWSNGVETTNVVITEAGLVGISTDTPVHALELHGKGKRLALTSNHSDGTRINHMELSSDGSGYGYMMVYNDVGNPIARIHSSGSSYFNGGNVGIGTTTPGYTLEVAKDVDDWVSRIYNTGSDANAAGMLVRTDANAAHNTHAFSVYADSGYKFSVRSGGNVGIGTSNPESELHIKSGADHGQSTLKLQGAKTGGFCSAVVFSNSDQTDNGAIYYNADENYMRFNTGGLGSSTERLRIHNNGVISTNGISNPAGTVHFTKSGGGAGNRQLQYNTTFDSTTTSGWCSLINAGASTGTIGVFQNQRSATLGTAANNSYGNSDMFGLLYLQKENGNNTYLWVDNSQNWRTATSFTYVGSDAGGTVVGTQTSDERLKNISPDFNYGIEHVLQLQPITYSRKDDTEPTQRLGFGAQTTQQIIPEAVYDTGDCVDGYETDLEDETKDTPKSDETILAMEYVQLIPVLTKAIQEQQEIIDKQQQRIDQMSERINNLES